MQQANQPGVITQPGSSQPVMANSSPAGLQPNTPYKVPALCGMAIVHIVLGFLSTILGIVAIVLECTLWYVGWGIWSGVLFFGLTGTLGVIAACKKNNGMVIASMVMSILSALVACQLFIVATLAAVWEGHNFDCDHRNGFCSYNLRSRVAVDSLLAITGLAEMVLFIVGASLSCYGVCSCCRPYTPVTVQYEPQAVPMMPFQAQQPQLQQQHQQQPQLQQQQAGYQFGVMNTQQQMPPQQQCQAAAMQGNVINPQYATEHAIPTITMTAPQAPSAPNTEHVHHDDKQGLLGAV